MIDTVGLRARSVAFWAGAADGWIRHADRQDDIGRPLGAAAMHWLRPQPGEQVLDVGCAAGGTTAELAALVAPGGYAVGVDLSSAMIAAARSRHPGDALRFVDADIETLDVVPGAPFDAAYARMVVMVLADPVAGAATVRRSLRPGGRFGATVFRDGAANPWLSAALLGAAPHIGTLPPLPMGTEPGPFALADPERARRVMTAAGFADVDVTAVDVTLDAPDDPDTVAEWLIEMGPAGAAYRSATPEQQTAARTGATRLLQRFRVPAVGYRLPSGIWRITATNPGCAPPG